MEASSSPIEETAMDIGVAAPRAKSKTALNRRPSGYWKVFSNWWRGRYATLKTRPTVNEVIEWYHRNAATSWPAGQVPCLKAVLRQSKGLRPIDGLKEYFREYRKKRKQQGGLALKASEDASQRRSRAVKRRRGRAAHKDSSDEEDVDEMEQEGSMYSDQHSSEDEDDEEIEDTPPRRQRGRRGAAAPTDADASREVAGAHVVSPFQAVANAGAVAADGSDGEGTCRASGLGTLQAVFDSWHHIPPGAPGTGLTLDDCAAAPALVDASMMPPDLGCVTDGPEGSFLSLPHALATASVGDPVHPAVAEGMVPIGSSGSPRPTMPHAAMYGSCSPAAAPYVSYIQTVVVRRLPSRFVAARTRCGAPVGLPPLSSTAPMSVVRTPVAGSSAEAAVKASPELVKSETGAKVEAATPEDDYAGDRCSTGGCVPAPCDARFPRPHMHERPFDGYGYDYVTPYAPPPPYACPPPHPCCYRPAPYPVAPYPYRAMSSASYPPAPDSSTGGGATSSFSPAAPWTAMPNATDGSGAFPQRQGSVESPAQLDACYTRPHQAHALRHPHPHHPAWNSWGTAEGAVASAWQSAPMPPPPYGHDPSAWCRNTMSRNASSQPLMPCGYAFSGAPSSLACPCHACHDPAVPFHPANSHCHQHAPGMRPPQPHGCYPYGPRHVIPAHPGRVDAWTGPLAGPFEHLEGPTGEGEACSSSVSEHDSQEHGHWSPCSGTSGPTIPSCVSPSATTGGGSQHRVRGRPTPPHCHMVPHGGHYTGSQACSYPPAVMYPNARGLVATGSVTSMASLAALPEESPFMAGAGTARPADALAEAAQVQGDACDVLPYLADAPAVPGGASDACADGKDVSSVDVNLDGPSMLLSAQPPIEPHVPALEVAECGLVLTDGFGVAAREAMDQDLAFAFENFVACDAPFDALACH
ncbi:hypothetical protein Vafri_6973 [Volvox africanus]|uniref:Uncharacterized protein n=2 Tax=Volvox africanus TaxID=51714 RepID=A0A8J4B0F5_9CHLO|nr:hypothetical protein Vafri_6973 [Volvox africanus]